MLLAKKDKCLISLIARSNRVNLVRMKISFIILGMIIPLTVFTLIVLVAGSGFESERNDERECISGRLFCYSNIEKRDTKKATLRNASKSSSDTEENSSRKTRLLEEPSEDETIGKANQIDARGQQTGNQKGDEIDQWQADIDINCKEGSETSKRCVRAVVRVGIKLLMMTLA